MKQIPRAHLVVVHVSTRNTWKRHIVHWNSGEGKARERWDKRLIFYTRFEVRLSLVMLASKTPCDSEILVLTVCITADHI